jgi:predicted kinase
MEKILYIVRGLPSSGKSTFAKTLGGNHYEADMYFMESGEYKFEPTKIRKAHEWCQDLVYMDMIKSEPVIVVSNTFTQEWEMKPYFELAEKYGYMVFSTVVEKRHNNKNNHNVPKEKIEQMKNRFEIRL